MQNVIERLKESKLKSEADNRQLGKELGIEWAKTTAQYSELESIENIENNFFDGVGPFSHAEYLAMEILRLDEENMDNREIESACEDFWECVGAGKQKLESIEVLEGFVEGAQELFSEVKNAI